MNPTETSGSAQQQQIDLDLEAYWDAVHGEPAIQSAPAHAGGG